MIFQALFQYFTNIFIYENSVCQETLPSSYSGILNIVELNYISFLNYILHK